MKKKKKKMRRMERMERMEWMRMRRRWRDYLPIYQRCVESRLIIVRLAAAKTSDEKGGIQLKVVGMMVNKISDYLQSKTMINIALFDVISREFKFANNYLIIPFDTFICRYVAVVVAVKRAERSRERES